MIIEDELSERELERMERLAEAATAGPWISYLLGRDADAGSNCIELGSCNELGSFQSIELIGASAADQDFIASARQDIPRLLGEVRALKARLDVLLTKEGMDGIEAREASASQLLSSVSARSGEFALSSDAKRHV